MNWFLDILKNKYVKFDGRAGRPEYWFFVLFNLIAIILVHIVDKVTGIDPALKVLVALALLLPGIAVSIRRLHDQNRSGWFFLISLIPFIGGLILLIFMLLPGTPGDNRFGPPAPTSPGTN